MRKIEKQFDEYLDYCVNIRMMSKETMKNKRWVLNELLRFIKIDDISDLSNKIINQWIVEQTKRGCNGRTINVRMAHLIAAIRYFQDMGIQFTKLNMRLLVKVKEMPPRRTYYTQEQIEKVLKYANKLEWLLISLCYDCGFRISEVQKLRIRDIDGQKITFIGKGSKSREVYMSELTRQKLMEWIEIEEVKDYLWVRYSHINRTKPISVEECRLLMRKAFHRAGHNDFYPHALRHSFATNICGNGAPLPIAQKMLGHSNLATTERYVHTFDGHLKEYFNQYKFKIA